MSHLLWKYYWENDVDRFRRLLAPTGAGSHTATSSPSIANIGGSFASGSPGGIASSPRTTPRPRKTSTYTPGGFGLNRSEINSRDHAGLTVLLRAASSTHPNARDFVQALLEHPFLDLYVQDPESGWNALHRSLYTGNVSIARLLLAKERIHLTTNTNQAAVGKVGQLIKTKDHEGNSPFDVYNSTIATRSRQASHATTRHAMASDDDGDDDGDDDDDEQLAKMSASIALGAGQPAMGDELFMFGSNKNLSLGVGDEDDRQYPERVVLRRPDALLHRFHNMYLDEHGVDAASSSLKDVPTLIRNPPLTILDVVMSKLHTAVLTNDPVSNLYICGVGRGGRLGTGDENTQFKFVSVEGPFADRKVCRVALGQNHSMAITENGELWTWGLNSDSQLGYALPPIMRIDEEPMSLAPRQVFGPLKKELVQGIAASAVHSVCHTASSLFCWGRNLGQLALMDADSRSLEVQTTPRKVAASLLSASIEMVSAIDKATTCLLSNCTVWVFTNYGYNLVKFPYPDVFSNQNLTASSYTHRYDAGRRHIRYISSGDETIAAVTSCGDLFTMQLNTKADANQYSGSTTNPVKIKSAVTQPRCIWDSRKDGVASVSVSEHGSVIICTESGAVWRRIKRPKGKITIFPNHVDMKKKDFKFERVPYITNCVSVRSSTFGAFSAIRQDSRVMSSDVSVMDQAIWDDIGALLCLNDFQASSTTSAEVSTSWAQWSSAVAREKGGSVSHEILRSWNIEQDVLQWIATSSFRYKNLNMEVRTSSSPDLKIPIHSWILTARSPFLRAALSENAVSGHNGNLDDYPDIFSIEQVGTKTLLTFIGVDMYTLLNIVVYVYLDAIVPVWRYTREWPSLAYRFRHVRTELMKLGTRLQMPKLEAAARLQEGLEPSLDVSLRDAIADPAFFHDADMIIELDGDEVHAHSDLVCQRCPFFEGMFRGRSLGQWVSGRCKPSLERELTRVNLNHISPETFDYVMRYLYADVGVEIFNDVCMETLDEFSELVLDVMSVANELMMDRLSQICQRLLGKFVTTRNIANLLNEISPCSVTEFKDVGLEYICLQLESMLENHLLDGLDQDLLLELDEVVRSNQLAQFPIVRSGRADALLHDQYPDLALDIEEERRRRVKEMAFKLAQRDEERKACSSYKARVGSLDGAPSPSHVQDRSRRKSSKVERNEPLSPNLRPTAYHADLIFNMDDEDGPKTTSSRSLGLSAPADGRIDIDLDNMPRLPAGWRTTRTSGGSLLGRSPGLDTKSPSQQLAESSLALASPGTTFRPTSPPARPTQAPWASPLLPSSKLDLKDIMQEATSQSALSAGLASQAEKAGGANRLQQARMSQKERKRQQQLLQAEADLAVGKDKAKVVAWETLKSAARPAPWKGAGPAPKTCLNDAMKSETGQLQGGSPSLSPKSSLVAGGNPALAKGRAASPDTRFAGQGKVSNAASAPAVGSSKSHERQKPLVPHSKSYLKPAPKAEAMLGLSMADIIGQQELEQQRVKDAVAKRSLQEIQEEQAFQEWWDQESRRMQEEEAKKQARADKSREQSGSGSGGRRRRGGGGQKGRGGKTKGGPAEQASDTAKQAAGNAATSSRGRGVVRRGARS
ncbi:hypothetical protein E4U42_006913 [Claviceps africana]|uniref:BTB domain-containing protein n=1 Tax=Claviceps africana TaxID=83212 RepID=A0A8K0NNQ3_9HYPO|nr:hypothetical protein E4U42_006913 [Claviceps africana]